MSPAQGETGTVVSNDETDACSRDSADSRSQDDVAGLVVRAASASAALTSFGPNSERAGRRTNQCPRSGAD
jgi:hypothetical protein